MKYLYNTLNNPNWEEVKELRKSKIEEITTNKAEIIDVVDKEDVIVTVIMMDEVYGVAAQRGTTSSLVVVQIEDYEDLFIFCSKYLEDIDEAMYELRSKVS